MDNFLVISPHEITNMSIIYKQGYTHAESEPGYPFGQHWSRRGRLGNTPVIYRTYHSRSGSSGATRRKAIENELEVLTRCLHHNIATVIGITAGHDGVNGYVLSASKMSLDQFMLRVDSGASLVRCIRGYESALATVKEISQRLHTNRDEVTVTPEGRVTVSPGFRKQQFANFGLDPHHYRTLNPATSLVLEIYYCNGPTAGEPALAFWDDVEVLSRQTFTVLEVARLAARHKVLPGYPGHHRGCWRCWEETNISTFTINVGHIGYNVDRSENSFWTPGELGRVELDVGLTTYFYGCGCDHNRDWKRYVGGQWMSIALCDCEDSWLGWTKWGSSDVLYEWASQRRTFLRNRGMEVNDALMCTDVTSRVKLRRAGSTRNPHEPLYFHCNPSVYTQAVPQAFWGFLSTSADPYSPETDPAEVGLRLTYRIYYKTVYLSNFWDYKYEKMLQSALTSIPGGYLGSQN